ncbi:DNA repair XRCC2-like protein [Nymphaea thermarum]|nr:DNA repair XRCC2-like protein [Nymphaea thermarum]
MMITRRRHKESIVRQNLMHSPREAARLLLAYQNLVRSPEAAEALDVAACHLPRAWESNNRSGSADPPKQLARWSHPGSPRNRGNMGTRHEAEGWIGVSETAQEMLGRTLIDRPCLIAVPPLHRVPLRPGNVVELVGPSASAKSEILLQAAISCILPNVCNGVFFGGMQRLVMYFDLDCSFDVQRFSNSLKKRIADACGKNLHSVS